MNINRSSRLFCLLMLVLGGANAGAQWKTEQFLLKPGWTAVYLHVDASHVTLDDLIADDPGSPIREVWLWQPAASTVQFVETPQEPTTANSQWLQWNISAGISDALVRLVGNGAYLVYNSGTSDYTWNIKGKAVPFRFDWTSSGVNFVGFPTPSVSPPVFDNFLSPAPALYPGAEIYHYPGGELGSENPKLFFATLTKPVTRGEAFWIRRDDVYNRYYGPVEISLQSAGGVDFGGEFGQYRVRLRNLTASRRTVTLNLLNSEAPPAGQPAIAGPPPLLVRGSLNAANLTYEHTVLDHEHSFTLEPDGIEGSEMEVVLGLNRSAMTGPAGSIYAGILRFEDTDGLSQNDLPVSAAMADTGGLWVGKATVTHVAHYLKTYLEDENGELVTGSVTSSGAPYIATGTNTSFGLAASTFPLRLILHHDAETGEMNLLQRVYYGYDRSTNVVVTTQEAVLDPASISSAFRISAAHLPFSLDNQYWNQSAANSTNVTVGVFRQELDGSFTDTGVELVFSVQDECQTWTRTAQPDAFDPAPHLHYNAAMNTSYSGDTFTWTEFGPEHSQSEIEAVCAAGVGGVTKMVNSTGYYEDHPGVFLKITRVQSYGSFQLGSSLSFNVPLDYNDHASNPFLHTFHPDHDNLKPDFRTVDAPGRESYSVTRKITLFLGSPADDFNSLTSSAATRVGGYGETISFSGLGGQSREFNMAGVFELNRVIPISQLTTE